MILTMSTCPWRRVLRCSSCKKHHVKPVRHVQPGMVKLPKHIDILHAEAMSYMARKIIVPTSKKSIWANKCNWHVEIYTNIHIPYYLIYKLYLLKNMYHFIISSKSRLTSSRVHSFGAPKREWQASNAAELDNAVLMLPWRGMQEFKDGCSVRMAWCMLSSIFDIGYMTKQL